MNKYIKSPLNYTGGKYKLLEQIMPLFPKEIDIFVDLFCGGLNVSVNTLANKYICNDIEEHVIDFYENLKNFSGKEVHEKVLNNVEKYNLSKTNKEGFLKARQDYNSNKTYDMFYAVLTHAFNNQIRFNKNGNYNISFGKDRSSYNASLKNKLITFTDKIDDKYRFTNLDFRKIKLEELSKNSFVYCDPPYLITNATYNENGGWTEEHEYDLLNLLDRLNNNGIKFSLSNVLTHKGKENDILIKWCKKYNVHHLNYSYSNCTYYNKNGYSDEVLITNY